MTRFATLRERREAWLSRWWALPQGWRNGILVVFAILLLTLVVAVLGDIARAKGMSQIAREAGLGRESLYKALSTTGNPEFATILKVVRALGLQFRVQATRA